MTKVIRNYDEKAIILEERRNYLVTEEEIEEFKKRLESEDVEDIADDMRILQYFDNDYMIKNRDGDVYFLVNNAGNAGNVEIFGASYVYVEDENKFYTKEELYEDYQFSDSIEHISYSNDGSRFCVEENPIEFEYDDYEVLIPVGHHTDGVTAYFTKDEMVFKLPTNYGESYDEVVSFEEFKDTELAQKAFSSEEAQEFSKRDDVPEAFKEAIEDVIKYMKKISEYNDGLI